MSDPSIALSEFLGAYRSYLEGERGLGDLTVGGYVSTAELFMLRRCGGDPGRLASLGARDVSGFVLSESDRGLSPRYGQRGGGPPALVPALPVREGPDRHAARPGHTLDGPLAGGSLPRSLEPGAADALLASCDRSRVVGRRDYAVLLLLIRLGLRAREIVTLTLDEHRLACRVDLDPWQGTERRRLAVALRRRTGPRRLPASTETPATSCRALFVKVVPPQGGISADGGQRHRALRLPARRDRPDRHASLPPRRGHRAARCRRRAPRDRPAAAAPPPPDDGALCQGRLRRAGERRPALARSPVMSVLGDILDEYLALRRSVGFKLAEPARVLPDFVAFLDAAANHHHRGRRRSSGPASTRLRPGLLEPVRVFARYRPGDRPRHRGARRRLVPEPPGPPDSLSLLRGRDRRADGCRPDASSTRCGRGPARPSSACCGRPACASARCSGSSAPTCPSRPAC